MSDGSDSDKTSTTLSLCTDENDNRLVSFDMEKQRNQSSSMWFNQDLSDSETDEYKANEKMLGDGSDEDDSLLVVFEEPKSEFWRLGFPKEIE